MRGQDPSKCALVLDLPSFVQVPETRVEATASEAATLDTGPPLLIPRYSPAVSWGSHGMTMALRAHLSDGAHPDHTCAVLDLQPTFSLRLARNSRDL